MRVMPALDVNVSARRQSCILDVPLVLSRSGLLFAVRVARELNVWLARTLWQILDNTEFYRAHPRLLHPTPGEPDGEAAGGCEETSLIIREWEQARLESDLLGLNVFWAGDARHESLLPKDVDKQLTRRFERACQDLDEDWAGEEGDYDPLRECHRDVVALAMALMPYGSFILTLSDDGHPEGVPAICRYLEECGIPARQVNGSRGAHDVRTNLQSIFARTSVAELIWAGLDIVALHVVAPRALLLGSDDEDFINDDDTQHPARRPHDGASAWWWRLS